MTTLLDQDDGILTEQDGPTSVKLIGFQNPSPFLERTTINRSEAYLMLQGHSIDLVARNGTDPYLKLTPEIRFQYMTEADISRKTGMPKIVRKKGGKIKIHHSHLDEFSLSEPSLFTETSKMSAASWSIPAGPPSVGGACAAAELFRNVSQYQTALRQGDVEQRQFDKSTWICQFCYAGKSNYMHRTSQYSQTSRWVWLKGIIANSGMDRAIDLMEEALRIHLGNSKQRMKSKEDPKFFRIHDSGDLTLVPNTYLLWCEIARRMPNVSFWCPSRQWVFPKFNEMVRQNPFPKNFSLRPSALHFGDIAPEVDGWSSGSTAHDIKDDPITQEKADWICPAYQHDGHSCAGAGGPNGEKDCRVCWNYREMAPSYRSH